jgi:transposase
MLTIPTAVTLMFWLIVWHVLAYSTPYAELGFDYFERRNETEAYKQRLVRQLEKLGLKVIIEPAA